MRRSTPKSKPRQPASRPLALESLETRLALSGFGLLEPDEAWERGLEPPCCASMSRFEPQFELRSSPAARTTETVRTTEELVGPVVLVLGRPSELRPSDLRSGELRSGELSVNVILVTRVEFESPRATMGGTPRPVGGLQDSWGNRPAPVGGEGESPLDEPLDELLDAPPAARLDPPLDARVGSQVGAQVGAQVDAKVGASLDMRPDLSPNALPEANHNSIADAGPVLGADTMRLESSFTLLAGDLSALVGWASPGGITESNATGMAGEWESIGWSTSPLTAMSLTSGEGWLEATEDERSAYRTDPYADGEFWWTDEEIAEGEANGESEMDADPANSVGDAAASGAAREGVRREAGRREAVRRAAVRERSLGETTKQQASGGASTRRIVRDRAAVDADGFVALSSARHDARRAESSRSERVVERAWVRMGAMAARSQSFEVGEVRVAEGGKPARGSHAISWSRPAASQAVSAQAVSAQTVSTQVVFPENAPSAAESAEAEVDESSSATSSGWWIKLFAGLSVLGVLIRRRWQS